MDVRNSVIGYKDFIQSPAVDFTSAIDYSNVRGKTILITGGASGIGEALAIDLAEYCANVMIADRNAARGTDLVARLRSTSNNEHHGFIQVDVTDWDSQVKCFQEAARLSPHGGIDIVVAGAGINDPEENAVFGITVPDYPKLAKPPAPKMKTLKVDLDGVLYTSTLALSYLSQNPDSRPCAVTHATFVPRPRDRQLILISSIVGVLGFPANGLYAAAKHGVVGLFRSLRLTAPILQGVRVNMINPYYVDTPITDIRGHVPLLGLAMTKIERVTEALMRLCADDEIVGRAFVIGPDGTKKQLENAGLAEVAGTGGHAEGAIVDLYAHDFEQADLLMRRAVGLVNLVTNARGWVGFFADIAMRTFRAGRSVLPL